jgi:hypothetical protein
MKYVSKRKIFSKTYHKSISFSVIDKKQVKTDEEI